MLTLEARLNKTSDALINIAIAIASVAMLAMVVNVALDVALRSFFNLPIQETTPLVTYWWMLPLVFLGIAAAQKHDEHTDLPILHERLSERGQVLTNLTALAFTAVFIALIGWFGLQEALQQFSIGEYDSSSGVITWPPRFILPLACLAMLIVIVAQALRNIAIFNGQEVSVSESEINHEDVGQV